MSNLILHDVNLKKKRNIVYLSEFFDVLDDTIEMISLKNIGTYTGLYKDKNGDDIAYFLERTF